MYIKKTIVIWKKPDNEVYYKIVCGLHKDYIIGEVNSYNHKLLYVINNVYFSSFKPQFKERIKKKLISKIEKL